MYELPGHASLAFTRIWLHLFYPLPISTLPLRNANRFILVPTDPAARRRRARRPAGEITMVVLVDFARGQTIVCIK
jgi:hypothetical protein